LKRDKFVDFFEVAPGQVAMHKRLENWALSCHSAGGSSSSPMFRLYRPDNWERIGTTAVVDFHDAAKIARGIAMLPIPHRKALQWNYVIGGSPTKARKQLGVTAEGLMLLIRDGRQMLINRGV
jgi:hypothetical protein